jgi:hypothetical protein
MPQAGFDPTIPEFEEAKTVHAVERAATVIGPVHTTHSISLRYILILSSHLRLVFLMVSVQE